MSFAVKYNEIIEKTAKSIDGNYIEKALDELWQEEWLKDALNGNADELINLLEESTEEIFNSDRLVIIGEDSILTGLKGVLTPLKSHFKREVIFVGPTYSAGKLSEIVEVLERGSFSILAITKGQESLAMRTVYFTLRSLLIEKAGANIAGKKICIVAPENSQIRLGQSADESMDIRCFDDDFEEEAFLNSPPLLLALIGAGIDCKEYAKGFKGMISSTLWDRNGSHMAAYMALSDSDYKGDGVTLYWQEELKYTCSLMVDVLYGNPKKALSMPESTGFVLKNLKSPELEEGSFACENQCKENEKIYISMSFEQENYDLSLPLFVGVSQEGSLNVMLNEEMRNFNKSLIEKVPIVEISIDELKPKQLGELCAFIQMSDEIRKILRKVYNIFA